MLYQKEFGFNFKLGFNLTDYPFLKDKSWHNDVSPSFYYKLNSQYFVLWVDHALVENRENETKRYLITSAESEGDDLHPELNCNNALIIFEADYFEELKVFFTKKSLKY
ncbi:hypothetical protein MK852_10760 [Shewanella benthica]|nr:hypothetical protein [Shewanella benthica]